MTGDERIAVVIRPLDRVLEFLKFALAPVFLLMASIPTLSGLTSTRTGKVPAWAFALFAAAAALAYVYVIQTQDIGHRVDRLIARIRRHIVLACNHTDRGAHRDSRIACRLTPELLRAPIFRYEQQRKAVSRLHAACTQPKKTHGEFWFVEGESGSGKTCTALRLVQSLIRDPEHFELGSRCFLYDFRASTATQNELLDRLGSPHHDGAVVFVDNFQLVSAEVLKQLTDRLMDNPSVLARLVVFLTRPSDAWNLGGGSDVRLLSDAKDRDCYLTLVGPAIDTVERSVSDVDLGVSRLVGDLDQGVTASAVQLHLAQVIVRNNKVPPEVLSLLHLLGGRSDCSPSPLFVRLIAVVSGLSMHRGGFDRGELLTAISTVAREHPRSTNLVRMLLAFRRLHKIGLVARSEQDGPRYVFHEGVAEHCIDQLYGIPDFKEALEAVGSARLRRSGVEAQDRWLIAAEIDVQDVMTVTFDEALANGSYGGMARCLTRAQTRYELSQLSKLQLAILLNRTGSIIESRQLFAGDWVEPLGSSEDLALMLLTSRMEATHDDTAEEALVELRDHDDPLVAIIGEYWQIHMAAHRGLFDTRRLLDLAAQARELLGSSSSYWLTYSVARMYFDSWRHYYLEGAAPVTSADLQTRRELDRCLRGRLTTFEALHVLYTQAHFVGHVLLPRLGIFKELISEADADRVGISFDIANKVEGLVKTALHLYQRAHDEFSQYGDREALYLRADILNAKMIANNADLDSLEAPMNDYAAFGAATFKLIASYPHFYRFRWHMLKFYQLLFQSGNLRDAERHRSEARRRVDIIGKLDSEVDNRYGVLRAEMLDALIDISEDKQDNARMNQLEHKMSDHSYGFEARLLRHLIDSRADTITDLRDVIRFYPFAHQ